MGKINFSPGIELRISNWEASALTPEPQLPDKVKQPPHSPLVLTAQVVYAPIAFCNGLGIGLIKKTEV